jgi:hypothetical protein
LNGQMDPEMARWFPVVFPFLFIGMWLAVTTMLGVISGWFALQQHYPRGEGEPLFKQRITSASMGPGVHFRRVITVAAYPTGLRISASRLMAPFQRPFLVPWSEIEAEEARSFFVPMVRLRFGRPEIGKLTIGARDWQHLSAYAAPQTSRAGNLRVEPASNRAVGAGLLVQWAIAVAVAGTFFMIASGSQGRALPIWLCYGFPAIAIGGGQLIRWLVQLR